MDWIKGQPWDVVLEELKEKRKKDSTYSSSKILGSMCSKPHPKAQKAYVIFLETNMGDPELFPGTREIEEKVIEMAAGLLHAPVTYGGKFLSGGTEGNLTALHIAKSLSKKREVILTESAHFSFQKAASLMDLKLTLIPSKDHRMDTKKLRHHVGKNTACVVGIAGTTSLGTIDPIPEIAEICQNEHIFFHVDAAFGGFIIPFLHQLGYPKTPFDFRLPGVSSITLDPHKMGCSVIPSGILILRDKEWIKAISVPSPCISTKTQESILGTRPGAAAAATYAVMKHLGQEGYQQIAKKCIELTQYAAKKLQDHGFTLVTTPQLNVIGIQVKNPAHTIKKLTEKQWKIGYDPDIGCLRLVIMPHVKKRLINLFISDLTHVI